MTRDRGHQPDYVLLSMIVLFVVFGLVMLSSAGSVFGFQRYGDSNYFLKKQLISVLVGAVAFLVAYRIDYRRWRAWAVPALVTTVVLLLLVFLPGIGSFFLGSHRWVHLGPILFQPSELVKLTYVIYLAAWLEKREHRVDRPRESLVPFLLVLGVIAGLVIAEPDMGTTTVIILTAIAVYFLAGGPWKHLLGLGAVGAAFFTLLIAIEPYRFKRFTVFLNPAFDPQGIGYHINQALMAIGSGGWFGLGLGHSQQKFNYLPEPAGDSIFAVTAEELGFVIVTLFVAAWVTFVIRGIRIARHAPDLFGQLTAAGIVIWLSFQAFLNIAALSGLVPLTGIPLPFMSHGGSAMIVSLAAAGLLLNISRFTSYSVQR